MILQDKDSDLSPSIVPLLKLESTDGLGTGGPLEFVDWNSLINWLDTFYGE